MKDHLEALTEELCALWHSGSSLDEPLSQFVVETASRASGCWRLHDRHLRLIGFGWASDMSKHVSQGFQDATRCVSLDELGLGIVKAAVTGKPAIGRRDSNATGLDGSASWIVKFGANTSLAVPIHDARTRIVGVLAVSTADFVEERDAIWQTMHYLSNELGKAGEQHTK